MGVSLAQLKENRFDFVHDSRKIFRVLMNALAFPGRISGLPPLPLCLTKKEYGPVLLPLLTLLDPEAGFCIHAGDPEIHEEIKKYLMINTNAVYKHYDRADFILCLEPGLGECFPLLSKGSLSMPHKSATVFYLVKEIQDISGNGAIELILAGPGIKKNRSLFITGITMDEIRRWKLHRGNFPLGIDIFLVSRGGKIAGIPRSVDINI